MWVTVKELSFDLKLPIVRSDRRQLITLTRIKQLETKLSIANCRRCRWRQFAFKNSVSSGVWTACIEFEYRLSKVIATHTPRKTQFFARRTSHFSQFCHVAAEIGFNRLRADVIGARIKRFRHTVTLKAISDNREADRCLCFRYIDSTIPLLPEPEISSL